jgi:hypothetical protein
MVNPMLRVGSDTESISARAVITCPTSTTADTAALTQEIKHDDIIIEQSEYEREFPPLPSLQSTPTDPHFLTQQQTAGFLPTRWRDLLPKQHQRQVQRLFVRADGSCAGGAVVRGMADGVNGMKTLIEAQDSEVVRQFRTVQMIEYVQSCTDVQWCDMVHSDLRDSLWDARLICQQPTARSVTAERQVFYDLCSRPNYAIGTIFFPIAAAVMGVGILLLVTDMRYSFSDQQQLYDFGTTRYDHSMIVFHLYPKPPQGVRGGSGVGHYETVGRVRSPGQPHQTLFARGDPFLHAFRIVAIERSDNRTLESLRILYRQYDPPIGVPVAQRLIQDVPTNAAATAGTQDDMVMEIPETPTNQLASPDDHYDTEDSNGSRYQSAGTSDTTQLVNAAAATTTPAVTVTPTPITTIITSPDPERQRMSGRRHTPSRHLTHPGEMDVGSPRRPRRSLSLALDRTVRSTTVQSDRGVPPPARSASSSRPSQRIRREASTGRSRPSVAAAAPLPVSGRADTMCAQILANVRGWVRRNACHGRLARRVHFTAIPQWTLRCRTVLLSLTAALRAEPMNELAVVANMCVLWALPGEMFAVPSRSRGGKRERRNRIDRIHGKLNDDRLVSRMLSELMDEMTSTTQGTDDLDGWTAVHPVMAAPDQSATSTASDPDQCNGPSQQSSPSTRSRTPTKSGDVKAVQRAEHMFALGDIYRAMQALTSTTETTDLNDREERDRLRQLHPSAPHPMPQRPGDAPEVMVDHEWMQAEMYASDTGASPGPSGYCSNYLSVLAADPQCVHAMAFFIQQIVNNRLPAVARILLTTCTLVSLKKGKDGRRPVAMGDTFYRMASRYALTLVTRKAQTLMAPHQYGAGQPDGCTQIIQSVQHLLTTVPVSPRTSSPWRPMACLSVDVSNAFNSIDRAVVLRAVYGSPELAQCWRMVEFGYGKPSLLLMQCDDTTSDSDVFIESQTGVRQGDPLAGLLFSLAMHSTYDTVAKMTSGGFYAYQDDGNSVGTIAECWQVWEKIRSLLATLGLKVNADKCELTCFHMDSVRDDDDHSALTQFRQSGLKINDSSVRMLGCVVGRDSVVVADILNTDPRFQASQLVAFRRLPLMKKQTAMLALQRLTGTVLTNRLRAMPPTATRQHAAVYDRNVMRTAHTIIRITAADGDKYDEQLQSSLSVGGFGLTSAVHIAPAAYIAGAENTLRLSPAFTDVWSERVPLPPTCDMSIAIEDSLTQITAAEATLINRCGLAVMPEVSPSILPTSAVTFVSHFRTMPPCLIQAAITHRINTLFSIARVEEARRLGQGSVEAVARLLSLKQAGSSLWLLTIPTEGALTLTDTKWMWAAQLRLGMPVPSIDDKCSGCNQTDAYTNNSWHSVGCLPLSGREITDRHNQVLAVIARFCRLMLYNVRTEPADLCHDSEKRPDIQIDLPDKTILGDVTITHPTAKTWRKVVVRRSVEAVGNAREKEKDDQYSEMAAALDMQFRSIVLFTYGGFHKSALRLVSDLTAAFDPTTCLISRDEYKTALMQQIAIAVQRGTADIMIRDSIRIRGSMLGQLRRRHLSTRSWTGRGLIRQQQTHQQQQQHQRLDSTDAMSGTDSSARDEVITTVSDLSALPSPRRPATPANNVRDGRYVHNDSDSECKTASDASVSRNLRTAAPWCASVMMPVVARVVDDSVMSDMTSVRG